MSEAELDEVALGERADRMLCMTEEQVADLEAKVALFESERDQALERAGRLEAALAVVLGDMVEDHQKKLWPTWGRVQFVRDALRGELVECDAGALARGAAALAEVLEDAASALQSPATVSEQAAAARVQGARLAALANGRR